MTKKQKDYIFTDWDEIDEEKEQDQEQVEEIVEEVEEAVKDKPNLRKRNRTFFKL